MSAQVDENPLVIHGRPDFGNVDFGKTYAKKHPPYVFSVLGASCLVHKVRNVQLKWWDVGGIGDHMVKRTSPSMIAHTVCGTFFFLTGHRTRTCQIPEPDAMLCGRCHGEIAPFGKDGPATKAGIRRQDAHVKLGCVVKGY